MAVEVIAGAAGLGSAGVLVIHQEAGTVRRAADALAGALQPPFKPVIESNVFRLETWGESR